MVDQATAWTVKFQLRTPSGKLTFRETQHLINEVRQFLNDKGFIMRGESGEYGSDPKFEAVSEEKK